MLKWSFRRAGPGWLASMAAARVNAARGCCFPDSGIEEKWAGEGQGPEPPIRSGHRALAYWMAEVLRTGW